MSVYQAALLMQLHALDHMLISLGRLFKSKEGKEALFELNKFLGRKARKALQYNKDTSCLISTLRKVVEA